MSTRRRLTLRQRQWLPLHVVRVFGPFADVTVDSLRDALTSMHHSDPAQPAVCRLDVRRRAWVTLNPVEFAERRRTMVVGFSPNRDKPAEALTRAMVDIDCGDRPVVFGVCDGYVAMKANHAVGDGHTLTRLLARVVASASTSSPNPDNNRPEQPSRAPLLSASTSFYMRDPRRLVQAVALKRLRASKPRGFQRPWHADPAFAFHRSTTGLAARVRAARDATAPGTSMSSIIIATVVAALAEAGLQVSRDGICVLVDGRRYLRPAQVATPNFVVGQFVAPTDFTDPAAIDEVVAAVLRSGRPLAAIAVGDLGGLKTPAPTARPQVVAVDPKVRLTISHMRVADVLGHLPWSGIESGHRLCVVNQPDGPEGMTITSMENNGALHLTASFHASTFSRDAVTKALGIACARLENGLLATAGTL